MIDLERAKIKFLEYVDTFDMSNFDISHKKEHSFEVVKIINELSRKMNLSEEYVELATLIGLLHDIGRFYQLQTTNSYDDNKFDHSNYGVMYLFENNHIRDFIDTDKYDEIIKKAVLYHNDYSLPDGLTLEEALFCKLIRDADKIDIFRVYFEYYKFYFNKDDVNPKVHSDFIAGKPIDKMDRKSKSDSVYIVLAFLNDINFKESYEFIEKSKYFEKFLDCVEVDAESKLEWDKLVEHCNKIIERRDKDVR